MFRFDLYGTTAYAYSLVVLFACFLVARRIIHSPFGLALRGIRENAMRMPAIGAPSRAHLRKVYTIAAVMAGLPRARLSAHPSPGAPAVVLSWRSAPRLGVHLLGGAR